MQNYDRNYDRNRARARLGLTAFEYPRRVPWANIGRNHPDYGMTVAEHNAAKAQRNG